MVWKLISLSQCSYFLLILSLACHLSTGFGCVFLLWCLFGNLVPSYQCLLLTMSCRILLNTLQCLIVLLIPLGSLFTWKPLPFNYLFDFSEYNLKRGNHLIELIISSRKLWYSPALCFPKKSAIHYFAKSFFLSIQKGEEEGG